ncbi:MAG: VWA domain-containing protein [Caldilineaceae bacterium]|nr:VWA domain-containing protein [Caldilineaceae bacterium]
MKRLFSSAGILLLIMLNVIAAKPAVVWAAPTPQLEQPSAPVDSSKAPIDVVILLDDSGSMATCWPWPQDRAPFNPPCGAPSPNAPSDPAELRYSAARLLLQLADAEDRVAVVRFDSDAEGVGELGTLQTVGSQENRTRLIQSLQPPNNYLVRGYTRMDLGLDQAAALLNDARQTGRGQYVLLLTDGEPSTQGVQSEQRARITEQLQQLQADDVFVMPVVLCNPSAGCADDFLSEQFPEESVLRATNAQDLLRVFTGILAAIKPDRAVNTGRDGDGALQLTTRDPQGVQQLAYVTPRGGLLSVRRDGAPILPERVLEDPNIDVNSVIGEQLAAGAWSANTIDLSGFTLVQAESYPFLLNPPPSIAGSPASVRYYPAGSRPLILAKGVGPAADEPIFYNGNTQMQPFGRDDLRALVPSQAPDTVRLQLGDDQSPLQLVRTYRLEPRADLPRLEIFSPTAGDGGITDDGHLVVQAGFGGGAVTSPAGTLYITDESDDAQGGGQLVYQATLTCAERVCQDSGFVPQDGRSYQLTVVAEGNADGIRYGDWAQTDVALAPAVYLRGLPTQLDLAQMPAEGWPVELASSTLEEIGALEATLDLRNADGETVSSVTVDFNEEVPEEGALATNLLVQGLDTLRPGDYSGELTLAATDPAGRPIDVTIRPGVTLPVSLNVPRPLARLDSQSADFGAVQFDTSPNFRLAQEVLVPVSFAGDPFPITARMADGNCANLAIVTGEVQRRGSQLFLPLSLSSSEAVPPGTCRGMITLAGPDEDHDVVPGSMNWQMRVDAVEWALVGADLDFGDLQDAGSQVEGTLLIRFNGKTPFVVRLQDVTAGGTAADGAVQLADAELEMEPVEVTWEPNEAGIYEVPVVLRARTEIPGDQLRGTYYAGNLGVQIAGLDEVAAAGFSLRSPSIAQRYVLPVLMPIYGLPQLICTGPLTLLLLLVLVSRWRGRGINEEEYEEAAMAAVMQMQTPESAEAQAARAAASPFVAAAPPSPDVVWGTSEWGSPWAAEGKARQSNGNGNLRAEDAGPDPWGSSWQ